MPRESRPLVQKGCPGGRKLGSDCQSSIVDISYIIMIFRKKINILSNSTFDNNTYERKLNLGQHGERCLMRMNRKCGASTSKSTFAEILIGREVGNPSLSIEITETRGRVWVGTDTVLTENVVAKIPKNGDAFK